MELDFLVKGLFLGFAVAAPVGPIGLLCIRKSLELGARHGFVTGLGAATADMIYAIVAGFGLTSISSILVSQQNITRLLGGIFLIYIGIQIFLSKPKSDKLKHNNTSLLSSYFSTFLLTITNPMTILSFVAVFAGLGLTNSGGNYFSAGILVAGVFLGSAIWWFSLSLVSSLLKRKMSPTIMLWINRFSGILILIFGLISIISILKFYI